MTETSQSVTVRFFQIFSSATAICFALSALANAFVFWAAWRVSYFSVADPADVVMSGLGLLARIALLFPIVCFFVFSTSKIISLIGNVVWPSPEYRSARDGGALGDWLGLSIVVTLFAAAPVSLWGITYHHRSLWSLRETRVERPDLFRTGLSVVTLPGAAAQCAGGEVLWLGASSAVLDCRDGVRIFHSVEDLVTRPNTSLPSQ